MAKNIYVGNINYSVTENDLQDLFSQYGDVVRVRIVTDKETKRSKGFGFVEMSDDNAAEEAINALNNYDLKGRQLKVNEARERTEQPYGDRKSGGRSGGGFKPRNNY